MSFINCFLKKKNGDVYLPKTTAQNVSLSDGTDLDTKLSAIGSIVEINISNNGLFGVVRRLPCNS